MPFPSHDHRDDEEPRRGRRRARPVLTHDEQLFQAVWNGDQARARELLVHGADPHATVTAYDPLDRDASFRSEAFRQACLMGDASMVAMLMAQGARPERLPRTRPPSSSSGGSPWGGWFDHDGFLEVGSEAVADLLDGLGWPADQDDLDRSLLDAATRHLPDLVARRLAAGADVNARIRSTTTIMNVGQGRAIGNTALHLALRIEGDASKVQPGRGLAVVQRLLAAGADPNLRNDRGYTPLLQGLLDRYSDGHPGAIEQSRALCALVLAGADVNATGDKGSVLLWALESRRHDALVPLLLDRGARLAYAPGAMKDDGSVERTQGPGSALLGALFNGTLDQVRTALEQGEDPHATALTLPSTCMYDTVCVPLVRAVQRIRPSMGAADDFEAVLDLMLNHGLDLRDAAQDPGWVRLVMGTAVTGRTASNAGTWARIGQVVRRLEAMELRSELDGTPLDPGAPTVRRRL